MKHITIIIFFLVFLLCQTINAQKHHPSIQWVSIQSQHFIVHVDKEFDSLGLRILDICEESYLPVCQSLNYFPKFFQRKTHVVVHTQTDITNGFATILPVRMELFIVPTQENWMGSKENDLRTLIVHELTHTIHYRKRKWATSWLYPFLGDFTTIFNLNLPNWFTEGIAVKNETELTRGGRGRNPYFTMQMQAMMESDCRWDYESLNFPSRKRMPWGIWYVAGYHLVKNIDQAGLLDRFVSFPLDFDWAAHRKLKVKFDNVYENLSFDQFKIVQSIESEQIVENLKIADNYFSPRYVSPESVICYRYSFDHHPGFVMVHKESKKINPVLDRYILNYDNGFDIGEDFLVWAETDVDPFHWNREYSDLKKLDLNTNKISIITKNQRIYSPDISPDQLSLAAVATAVPNNKLVRVDIETGDAVTLLKVEKIQFYNPRWSDDGNLICFAVRNENFNQDIAIIDLQTNQWRLLYPSDPYHENSPVFSPDGKYVFYSSDRTGKFNIWVVEIETGKRWQVTDELYGAFTPDVSPQGELVFSSYCAKGFKLKTLYLDKNNWIEEGKITSHYEDCYSLNDTIEFEAHNNSTHYKINKYNPLKTLFYPQGWILGTGLQDYEGESLGLTWLSTDPLNRHNLLFFTGFNQQKKRFDWDVLYRYQKYFVEFQMNTYSVPQIDKVFADDFWTQKKGSAFELSIPAIVEYNNFYSFIYPFVGYKRHQLTFKELDSNISLNYEALNYGFSFQRLKMNRRDIKPQWGFSFYCEKEDSWPLFHKKEELKNDFLYLANQIYTPGFFNHHSFEFFFQFQKNLGNYGYYSYYITPTGYDEILYPYHGKFRFAYHFPISYLETGFDFFYGEIFTVPWYFFIANWSRHVLYVERISGNIFYECGLRKVSSLTFEDLVHQSISSVGLELNFLCDFFNVIPADIGYYVAYKNVDKQFTFGMRIDGLSIENANSKRKKCQSLYKWLKK